MPSPGSAARRPASRCRTPIPSAPPRCAPSSAAAAAARLAAAPLWRADAGLEYEDVALYNAGFSIGPPDIAAIRRGERSADVLPPDAASLVLWADALGVQAGDVIVFSIRDPGGKVLHRREQAVDRTQARRYGFSGMKRPAEGWLPGIYTGEVVHIRRRGGQELMSRMLAEQRIATP